MGNSQKKPISNIFYRFGPLLCCLIVIFYFALPVFTKQQVIGPFDFLVNWYHPYQDLPWEKTPKLYEQYTKPKTYLMSDVVGVVFPIKYYSIESLKKGSIPLWNPAILNGAPHLANTQSSALNPFNFVFIVFGYLQGFNVFILLQLLVAFSGMYLFLKQLINDTLLSTFGAITFAFSGYMIVWLPWGTIGYAYSMLPWALYLTKRKYWMTLVPLAIAVFAGHIQTAFIITVCFYTYALYSKVTVKNIFVHAIALLCLSAPQLLPTIQLVKYSGRSLVSSVSFYLDQSLLPHQLITVFAPDFFGNPVTRNWWGHNNYAETVSFAGTLFALTAIINVWYVIHIIVKKISDQREIVFFVVVGLVSIILSVQNPILFILYKLNIPIFSTSTFSRNLSVLIFANIVTGILLLSAIKKRRVPKIILLGSLISTIIVVALIWSFTFFVVPHTDTIASMIIAKRNLLLPTILVGIYIIILFLLYTFKSNKYFLLIFLCMASFHMIDMTRFAKKYTPFSPREFFYPKTALGEYIGNNLRGKTYLNLVDANLANIINGETLGGSDPLFLKEYAELATSDKIGKPSVSDRTGVPIDKGPYFMKIVNILGAQYIVDKNRDFQNAWEKYNPGKPFDTAFIHLWSDGIYHVSFNAAATDPVYMVNADHVIIRHTNEEALSALLSNEFKPKLEVVVSQAIDYPSFTAPTAYRNTVRRVQNSAQYQKIELETTTKAVLINNQTFYPSWKVRVDGHERPLLKVNYILQGVALSPGKHIVEFYYEDRFFIAGCLLFIIGIIFLVSKTRAMTTPIAMMRSLRKTSS